ncbi:MAG: hypothetical protein ABIT09_07595 [Croceibacterium sp.]
MAVAAGTGLGTARVTGAGDARRVPGGVGSGGGVTKAVGLATGEGALTGALGRGIGVGTGRARDSGTSGATGP